MLALSSRAQATSSKFINLLHKSYVRQEKFHHKEDSYKKKKDEYRKLISENNEIFLYRFCDLYLFIHRRVSSYIYLKFYII